MSNEITKARKNLNSVSSLLKQNKILPAVNAFYDGLLTYLKGNLLQNEKKEFADLLDKTVYLVNSHPKVREIYPILLTFESGKEKELVENLRELLNAMQNSLADNAKDTLAELEKRKRESLAQARQRLDEKDIDNAQAIFKKLVRDFDKDFELKIDITDLLINAQEYQKAIEYLKLAYKDNPGSVHIYNRLGMALRKLGRFEDSEKAYQQAIQIHSKDEYLHFNLGRLYIDAGKLTEARLCAEKALKINPDFDQARKMLNFTMNKTRKNKE
ncbi:tetratricopeptide repeat protein [Desulfonatronovibrio hydrogenovorans]|uniref:tetratricopeptide repeat protein n=1 Tax=Desulfonatronovibrio hydrogenovorans TaxID=53245 RepID=UPI00048C8570|nr:tetratricopeptide repeat protein [Desulfonatronovibrio hydrogenovorans]